MASVSKKKLEASDVARVSDRLSFIYLERCVVHRDANAITATDNAGVVHLPAASLGVLMLGPGTRVSYAAMALLGDSGVSVVWVGENGVRYYANGRSLARSTRLLEKQAKLVSNSRTRLAVARKMYDMRFPGENVSSLTMQQLRGREGARVRSAYRWHASRFDMSWERRSFDPEDFDASDDLNKALTAGNSCMYGIVHSVIVALGCSPGLGFVHNGNDRSFVYDIADLYKTDIVVPIAFEVASRQGADLTGDVRREIRNAVVSHRLLERCARDIAYLLEEEVGDMQWMQDDNLSLWAGISDRKVAGGLNYGSPG
ncbi:type I-E CRISPR-associated endonuclease Cas1e [Auritidibacter ignavus]|uniref:type I-E CRISPR-associated endonuclease Cas1e n=1 Tax=Auritidibacter TaxID=1160973 RepID=UPI000D72A3AC|nr:MULTISPECIES: type I-E CRISPR-associated endonuclease Cas1e [Auritidibacter]PXA79275.1 type I-E CRISPR-associated endonuclease Cas1 [Auritidibacter sp. NML120779]PXA79354.1 type I-E CRISPR-associated endonuclease Cas1 [Auritidibacter sp. NML120636]WGH80915.1 type I-E CRISPR-associated endonuclease Cas1e [Auritidibacter ignavus]WGH85531.1 type I-E CRISPR-associated endonuclease Cas1e [Auritidibacter ignavus]WGH87818.1 type I-E CRISPR-associated endonuclease Cas1e [Auritidibacter ignavus]